MVSEGRERDRVSHHVDRVPGPLPERGVVLALPGVGTDGAAPDADALRRWFLAMFFFARHEQSISALTR